MEKAVIDTKLTDHVGHMYVALIFLCLHVAD